MEPVLSAVRLPLAGLLSLLSDPFLKAYVDSLELGHKSDQIKTKLLHTQGLLHKAQGSDAGHNPGLRGLLPALSRNADQAEDLLDEILYFQIHDKLHGTNRAATKAGGLRHGRNAFRHTVGGLTACFSCSSAQDDSDSTSGNDAGHGDMLSFDPVTMSRKIKSVLQDMEAQCDSVSDLLGNITSNSTAVTILRPQIGSIIIQDTLYGRGDIFEKTVNHIMSCELTVYVLPIVGPGGIGKTTFTQHLYNDVRTKKLFDVRVWVCASADFDVLKLTMQILGCIPVTEDEETNPWANETTNLDSLQKLIARRLKFKKLLIVFDDIWKCDSEDQWKILLAPFTKGKAKRSMVLVTTRFPKLADMMKTVDRVELTGLESNEFFTFFEACIFGQHNPDRYDDQLAGIARKIANKLKGSPLAAKTVGRLLQKDLSHDHWNGVLKKHEWLKQQNNDDIMPSLKISYDYLPFDLKKRLSYFGLFPEDHRFGNSEMNRLFVAIGIADSTPQVDRNYLEQLVENGFLMKGVDDSHEYYVLHDLMHELCRSVSTQECLNISDLDFGADGIPQSIRHLSITIEDRYDEIFEEEMCKLRGRIDIANLRSLMIFREYEERIAKILKDCFKEINSLRVLFIAVNSPESFPHRFSKLIHLQYLKISSPYYGCKLTLPSTLSRFYHLKFLDLEDWHDSSDLPKNFSHLENLLDFRAESELHSNIRNVGKIKHLQRLQEFCVKKESMGFELTELGALTELEELIICDLEHVATKEEATAAKLMLKRNLKELKLLWGKERPTIDADILHALQPHSNLKVLTIANQGGTIGPSWLCLDICLTSLETLTLDGICWSTLPPFGKLPNLNVLNLKRISGMRQFRCGGAPGKCFKRLKTVGFHEIPELVEWVVEPDCHSFPSLEIIECVKCLNLRDMPFSEESCTKLCQLIISGCPKISLPSMPHTSTLTDLVVERGGSKTLTYDGKELVVIGYGGALAFHNLDKVQVMSIKDVSHISLTDIEKLKTLTKLTIGRCEGLFPEKLDGSIVFSSLKSLRLDVSHLTSNSSSNVLNCFPALSVLDIESSYGDHDHEECVMQIPSSSSLQKLSFYDCKDLVLVPVENGGAIQEDNSSLQSLNISGCGKIFSRWPMGESGGGLPASLRELDISGEPSMTSMALLSNLTSLTSLRLAHCSNLTVDGLNPLIAVNLKKLRVYNHFVIGSNTVGAADLLSRSFRMEELWVDNISGLLVASFCNLLAPALHTLAFYLDERAESFTEEQEKALQLLTSLEILEFSYCNRLQSLPQGLHRLSSLKELHVIGCPEIRSMPKEGFPVSLRKLQIDYRSAEINEQIKKIERTNPDLHVTRVFWE